MTGELGHGIKDSKTVRFERVLATELDRGEEVLLIVKANAVRYEYVAISNRRVFGFTAQTTWMKRIPVQVPFSEPVTVHVDVGKDQVQFEASAESLTLKHVHENDRKAIQRVVRRLIDAGASLSLEKVPYTIKQKAPSPAANFDSKKTKTAGGHLTKKAATAVHELSHGDDPWLILVSGGGAGLLAAWDDRLAIIKTGALTSLMAGSLGGQRSATFHFSDITGLEYNSGMLNGVLEILTASYSGTPNRDFWRGTSASRNADANDPWTQSNTLPLSKPDYRSALTHIQELRRRIAESKSPRIVALPPSASPAPAPAAVSLGDELNKLAELRASGVLTDEEFTAAKARLLGG
jgi:hypothetical protein